jgi:hypothetical protein
MKKSTLYLAFAFNFVFIYLATLLVSNFADIDKLLAYPKIDSLINAESIKRMFALIRLGLMFCIAPNLIVAFIFHILEKNTSDDSVEIHENMEPDSN